VSNTPLELAAT